MNPYLKKFQYGGKGDPEDPIKDLLNYGLTPQNKQPIYGLPANPYQPASGYSWGSGMPNKPTEVVNTTGSGHSQTMPSVNTFQGNYDPRMPGEKALQAVDKAIGQHIVQPAMELYNTPFATVAEGVNALQGKEASLERALPNPTRIALNAQGIQGDIPNQQFLSDYVGVDREKNPYLALGLDILTPGPAMFAKPIQALTGIGKASKGTMQYASKMNALDRAIDNPLSFIKEEVSPFVSGVNPNAGLRFADQTIDATKALQQADQNVFNAAKQPQVAASTTQAVAKEYTPWTQQEMPGLHIKSTMTGSPFEKQLSKTGELNISNVQAHINRADVGQQDKFILQKVLNEKFTGKQKVDYNEFRKAIQEENVELNRVPVEEYQHKRWGVHSIGYPGLKKESYENSLKQITDDAEYYNKISPFIKSYEKIVEDGVTKYKVPSRHTDGFVNIPEDKMTNYLKYETQAADDFFEKTYPKKAEYEETLKSIPKIEIMTFENAEKFGKGNAKHFNDTTLAHTRTMVDPNQPDTWHTLEQQSDYWQDSQRFIPNENIQKNWNVKSIMKQQSIQEDMDLLEYMKKNKKTKSGDPVEDHQIKQWEERVLNKQREYELQKGDFANPQQKELLGNAHQIRLLQENVRIAAENGMNKVRYPTAETAAKIQQYTPVTKAPKPERIVNLEKAIAKQKEKVNKRINNDGTTMSQDDIDHYEMNIKGLEDELNTKTTYLAEHESILRKYKDNQKIIEKTLGVKVRTVTDTKGNTWLEFDIPDAYKQGKAEIKAFSINPILGGGAAGAAGSSMMQQPKEKFRTGGSVNPYLKQYNPGGKVIIDGKEVNTSSQEYKDLYNAGVLMGVDYEGLPNMYAPEVEVTAEAPLWLKQKRQQEQAEYTDEELERYMYQGKKPERDKNFILPPGERLNIYNSVVPYEYPHSEFPKAVKRYINDEKRPYFGQESVKEEGRDLGKVDEDAWAHFMGLPQLYNTVQKSEYFPTNSKDKNAEYYSIRKNYPDFDELLLENANNWFQKKENANATTLKGVGSPFMPLENVTYSKGQDEKGKYYSMYDIYDFNIPFQKGIGRPYDIYDRVYYDDSNPEKPTLLKNRYGGQNPYIKYANGGPVDPVDPEEEKRLMQERLMKYIRGNNENSTSILDVRAPNEYGISLGDRFNIQSGLSIDPMTGMPSGYGKLGVNSNGFNLGVEKKKGFETDANIFNLGYESPKFNIDASYSNENNMPSIRGNVGYNNNGINIGFGGNYSPDNKSISANIGYNKNGFNAGLNYDYSGQHSMSGNVGYGNDEYNVGLSGNVMPNESNIGLNATYNLGVKKPQKREEISLAYNKPIEINLIKEDNEYEDTDAEQAAGPPEMNYGGYVNPYMKTYGKGGNTKTSKEEVNCTNCGWSWKLSEGGNKPYMCHECNHDNSQEYKETANKQQYEKGGDIGLSTVEIERSERVYTPDGKLIMETPADAPTHEEGGVKVTLPGGSLVFPKKYYKALDAASGLWDFKNIAKVMLDNAEKAYLRGEAYSSGGKRQ